MNVRLNIHTRENPRPGLNEFRPAALAETARGTLYSRLSVNGLPTFRSRETHGFEHAKI
jgi:hypothetical protein